MFFIQRSIDDPSLCGGRDGFLDRHNPPILPERLGSGEPAATDQHNADQQEGDERNALHSVSSLQGCTLRVTATGLHLAFPQPGALGTLRNSCPSSPISKPSARESGRKWSATQPSFVWARTSVSTVAPLKLPTASSTASAPSA